MSQNDTATCTSAPPHGQQGTTDGQVTPPIVPRHAPQGSKGQAMAPAHAPHGTYGQAMAPAHAPHGTYGQAMAPAHAPHGTYGQAMAPTHAPHGTYGQAMAPAHAPRGTYGQAMAPAHAPHGMYGQAMTAMDPAHYRHQWQPPCTVLGIVGIDGRPWNVLGSDRNQHWYAWENNSEQWYNVIGSGDRHAVQGPDGLVSQMMRINWKKWVVTRSDGITWEIMSDEIKGSIIPEMAGPTPSAQLCPVQNMTSQALPYHGDAGQDFHPIKQVQGADNKADTETKNGQAASEIEDEQQSTETKTENNADLKLEVSQHTPQERIITNKSLRIRL